VLLAVKRSDPGRPIGLHFTDLSPLLEVRSMPRAVNSRPACLSQRNSSRCRDDAKGIHDEVKPQMDADERR
jgi:hypothetical protein